MKKNLIGRVQNTHGLLGNLKVQMYYPYTVELMLNEIVFLEDECFEVEKVFGVIKEHCIIKFKNIESIDDAKEYKEFDIFASVNNEEKYSFSFINYEVFRGDRKIGVVNDIQWINGIEYLELDNDLITIDQICKKDSNKLFLL